MLSQPNIKNNDFIQLIEDIQTKEVNDYLTIKLKYFLVVYMIENFIKLNDLTNSKK